jgi:hypothetical protein
MGNLLRVWVHEYSVTGGQKAKMEDGFVSTLCQHTGVGVGGKEVTIPIEIIILQ